MTSGTLGARIATTTVGAAFALVAACGEPERPRPREPASAAASVAPGAAVARRGPSAPTSAAPPPVAAIRASASASAAIAGSAHGTTAAAPPSDAGASSDAGADAVPALFGADGKPLPQTEERPSTTSPGFTRRTALLFEAIVKDDPKLALPAFFPLPAYELVKDVGKPAVDYKTRLIRNFERDIHEYHRKLGREPERARFVALDVPEQRARWMKPGSEGNKLGYYRVLKATLRVKDARDQEQRWEVTSLISWRGEWYVVHLNGFK